MYWVYEELAGQLHSRHPFNNQQDAIDYANKQRRDFAKLGSERRYTVYYHAIKVYQTPA